MPTSFDELVDSYACIFFDAYGVLKSSAGLYPGALDVLESLHRRGKQLYLVTNDASKSPHRMAKNYERNGDSFLPVERIISSGLLVEDYLRNKVRSGWVAYLGKEASAYYIAAAGLHPIPVSELRPEDHSPRCIVLLDDEGFDWFRDINTVVNLVRRHNIPVVVANTDITYPANQDDLNVAAGGLARLVEAAVGRQFIHFGKPDPMIFSKAFHLALADNPSLTKRDVLMVGDTLGTDIIGGNKYGLDTALVLSGTTLESQAKALIQATGISPTYICASILT